MDELRLLLALLDVEVYVMSAGDLWVKKVHNGNLILDADIEKEGVDSVTLYGVFYSPDGVSKAKKLHRARPIEVFNAVCEVLNGRTQAAAQL